MYDLYLTTSVASTEARSIPDLQDKYLHDLQIFVLGLVPWYSSNRSF